MSALDTIRIATPCRASWDEMRGDDRARFCAMCKLNVFDLSNMPERDALALIQKTEGRLCVRLWRRKDGTVITRDCPEGLLDRARRRSEMLFASLALLVVAILGGVAFAASEPGRRLMAWCAPETRPQTRPQTMPQTMPQTTPEPMMGAIIVTK
jgi:hypothetical protein